MEWNNLKLWEKSMKEEAFQIRVADHLIEIVPHYPEIRILCEGYLRDEGSPEYSIRVTESEIQKEQKEDGPAFPDGYLETLAVYRKLADWMIEQNVLLFHGSAVAVDGQAYLFTAPSGTGKSTHTRLWKEYMGKKAVMINDDKPLLKIEKDMVTVFGTPWNGKHGLGSNISAPLQGICLLSQGRENAIRRMGKAEAFPTLLNQSYRPCGNREKMERLLSMMERLLEVPVWQMNCTISQEAVQLAYETMKEK